MPKTLFDKIWSQHVIPIALSKDPDEQRKLIYIDLHLIHEVTSPQAFEGLRLAKRGVRRPDLTFATMDHNVPTINQDQPIRDQISAKQIATLRKNCEEFGITLFDIGSNEQGIVHIIGPELGLTQPGKTIVCGDSHTSTHGAFGALAFGIGTSEVEHVLGTQCLIQTKSKNMKVNFHGKRQKGVYAKDMILALIRKIGTSGGTGYVIEYTGEAVQELDMAARMTVCNMSIEAGARAGLMSPDEKTFSYLKNRPYSPTNEALEKAIEKWKVLKTEEGAVFDKEIDIDVSNLPPQITWGTSPGMVVSVNEQIPDASQSKNQTEKIGYEKALSYMGLEPGTNITDIHLDKVFIGSCTNGRLEDLQEAARYVKGRKKASSLKQVLVVPGSQRVKKEAETLNLHKVFIEAGFEWRDPGCSMCLAMNDDVLRPGEKCASTSNRNFEGRQGKDGRTFLVSPAMAALAAIHGKFVDIRDY